MDKSGRILELERKLERERAQVALEQRIVHLLPEGLPEPAQVHAHSGKPGRDDGVIVFERRRWVPGMDAPWTVERAKAEVLALLPAIPAVIGRDGTCTSFAPAHRLDSRHLGVSAESVEPIEPVRYEVEPTSNTTAMKWWVLLEDLVLGISVRLDELGGLLEEAHERHRGRIVQHRWRVKQPGMLHDAKVLRYAGGGHLIPGPAVLYWPRR